MPSFMLLSQSARFLYFFVIIRWTNILLHLQKLTFVRSTLKHVTGELEARFSDKHIPSVIAIEKNPMVKIMRMP